LAKRKLQRFAENATFPHFFQPAWDELEAGFPLRGRWKEDFFKNSNPLIIELGCGKGEYTVDLSGKYPRKNFIGIDKKGARMWRGAKTSHEDNRANIAFVRIRAESINKVFALSEVEEIWITFPEPQPKASRESNRFTSPEFIERFRSFLVPGGTIHLKTDNEMLYNYTLNVVKEGNHELLLATNNLYENPENPEIADVISVRTHYEKIWLEKGLSIKYLRFRL